MGELTRAARRAGQDPEPVVAKALAIVDLTPVDAALAVATLALRPRPGGRRAGRAFSLIDGIGLTSARSRGLRFLTLVAGFDGFVDFVRIQR